MDWFGFVRDQAPAILKSVRRGKLHAASRDPKMRAYVVQFNHHREKRHRQKWIEGKRQAQTNEITMAPIAHLFVLTSAVAASAYVVPSSQAPRPSTRLSESFGFDFAEDSYENTPPQLLGEANYKQWVQKVSDNSFLNRKV